jgi:hypothetical protein
MIVGQIDLTERPVEENKKFLEGLHADDDYFDVVWFDNLNFGSSVRVPDKSMTLEKYLNLMDNLEIGQVSLQLGDPEQNRMNFCVSLTDGRDRKMSWVQGEYGPAAALTLSRLFRDVYGLDMTENLTSDLTSK